MEVLEGRTRLFAALTKAAILSWALLSCIESPVRHESSSLQTATFEQLMASSRPRHLTWSNPNGIKESMDIIEAEIPVPPAVEANTKEYLSKVYGEPSKDLSQVRPTMIVLHSMALGNLRQALEESGFLSDQVGYRISKWGRMPVGAHFLVDRDGAIYCLAPPRNLKGEISYHPHSLFPLKRHVIEANPWAIGIENIAAFASSWPTLSKDEKAAALSDLTGSQIAANAKLVRWLLSLYPKVRSLFGHHQFNAAEFRAQLKGRRELIPSAPNPDYVTTGRYDPGQNFLEGVLRQVRAFGPELSSDL